MSGDKPYLNGTDPTENGINGSEDVEMTEETRDAKKKEPKAGKDKDGDEEMTVVVPPSKGSKTSSPDQQTDSDQTANGTADGADTSTESHIDPKEKAIAGECPALRGATPCWTRKQAETNHRGRH